MSRELRLQYPGALCHITNRGDQRADIFFADMDHHDYSKTLAVRKKPSGNE